MSSDNIYSTDLYADGTTIYDIQDDLETLQRNLQHSLLSLQIWCERNGMLLNTDKTKLMLITTRQKRVRLDENLFTLTYNDVILQLTTGDKILGVNIEQNLLWNNHFQCISRKVSSYIWLLSKIKSYLSTEHRSFFVTHIYSRIYIIVIPFGEILLIITCLKLLNSKAELAKLY